MIPGLSTGFQAVILCGPGTSLYPFTGADDLLPKALLPIANKPMIHYPLEWCEKAGFSSILILTLAEHLVAIQSYIHSHTHPFAVQVEAPSSLDDNMGTADVLRRAYKHGWITSDIIVLPCDLVTDLDPEEVLKMWMVENAGFDSDLGNRSRVSANAREDDGRRGGLGVWYETKGDGAVKGQETDFLALAPHPEPSVGSNPEYQYSGTLKTLLYNLPGLPIKEQKVIPLRESFLRKCRNFQLSSTRRDSGIYFFPFWVLKFIDQNPQMNSIREDVLPWWSKARWQNKRLAKRLGLLDILSNSDDFHQELSIGEMSTTRKRDASRWTHEDNKEIFPVCPELDLEVIAKQKKEIVVFKSPELVHEEPKSDTSSITTPPGDIKIPPMVVYLPNASTTFVRRVDTIQLYLFASLYLANPAFPSKQIKTHPSASIDQKAHVNRSDCLIGSKVTIAEKASVKRCVLGHGVSIARGARLLGCVLMDGASVAEGATLEGCVVGMNAVIGADAKLNNCQVSQGFFVESKLQAKNEIFVAFAGLSDDDDGPITSEPRLNGTYQYKQNKDQDKQEWNGLNKPCSPVKMEFNERNRVETNTHAALKHQTQAVAQKIVEAEIKKNNIDNNGDHEEHNEAQRIDGDQEGISGTIRTDKLSRADSFVGQNYKNREGQDNQGCGKDQKDEVWKENGQYQVTGNDETAEMNRKIDKLYGFIDDQELYTPSKQIQVYPDKRQDTSEAVTLHKNTATKHETTKISSTTNSEDITSVEAASKITPIAVQTIGPGLVQTWGLSILTLGVWFAVFTAICTAVERNGNKF